MATSNRVTSINTFSKGLWLDSIKSLQPEGTWSDALNMVLTTDNETVVGITNELSNYLCVELPGEIRGAVNVSERGFWVLFIDNNNGGEIGVFNPTDCCYNKVVSLPDIKDNIDSDTKWINVVYKFLGDCNELHIYWANNKEYRKLNIDDPCCNYEDTFLLVCDGGGNIEVSVNDAGGNLPNGSYGFAIRLIDGDGNRTNFYRIGGFNSVASVNYRPGENSGKSINIKVSGLTDKYGSVELACISFIDGITSVRSVGVFPYGDGNFNYVYTGDTNQTVNIDISEIIDRRRKYFKGDEIFVYDRSSILYRVTPENNLDYQREADKIKVKYGVWAVPTEYSHLYRGLRPNENYLFTICFNYCDGTSSADFVLSNDDPSAYQTEIVDACGGCSLPRWRVEDTSNREKLFIDFDNRPGALGDVTSIAELSTSSTISPSKLSYDDDKKFEGERSSIKLDSEDILSDKVFLEDLEYVANESDIREGCLCDKVNSLWEKVKDCDDCSLPGTITREMLFEAKCSCEEHEVSSGDTDISDSLSIGFGCGGGDCSGGNSGWKTKVFGKLFNRVISYIKDKFKKLLSELKNIISSIGVEDGEGKYISTGLSCSNDGEVKCYGQSCVKCINGKWHVLNNFYKTDVRGYLTGGEEDDITIGKFKFKKIYAEDGCTVIGVEPQKYSEGTFGYWETDNIYPDTENCDCEKVYSLHGQNVRLFRVPSVSKEPHFISFSGGVPSQYNMSNSESNKSVSFFVGLVIDGVAMPKNLPKPLDKNNPYSIKMAKRSGADKTVIGSGIAISCFKGDIQSVEHVFPKIAVNSFERFNRAIDPQGQSSFRGGSAVTDAAPYIIHSPDLHMLRPSLNLTECLFELEIKGTGFRHGLYAKGVDRNDPRLPKVNQRGTRQSVNLNSFLLPVGSNGSYVRRCVNGSSYVDGNSIVSKGTEFTYPLCNLWGESMTYVEMDGSILPLHEDGATSANYGGADAIGDGASDRSFTGDTLNHEIPIHDSRAHYVTLVSHNPNQYGSLLGKDYIPTGLSCKDIENFSSVEGICGDSFVGTMSILRTSYVSDKTGRKLSTFDESLGIPKTGLKFWDFIISGLLKGLSRTLSIKKCGDVPSSGDASDYRNMFGGLRNVGDSIGVKTHDGEITPGNVPPRRSQVNISNSSDINNGDNYYPQVVKTNVFSWFNSDVNTKYRIVGETDAKDVYYEERGGLYVDSSMPFGTDWAKSYLNIGGCRSEENPNWKMILSAVILFLFVYGIGAYFMALGISTMVMGITSPTNVILPVAFIVGVILGIFMILMGVFWISWWSTSDADNKVVDRMLGIKNCRPDIKNADGSYSLNDTRIDEIVDNYYKYDISHSMLNSFDVTFGMGNIYNTCICDSEYTNNIYFSNPQNPNSYIDSWSNFDAHGMITVPDHAGKVMKVIQFGSGLYVHTTMMILSMQSGSNTLKSGTGGLVYVSSDKTFKVPSSQFVGTIEGYGGTKDPNAGIVTAIGYIFIDREAKRVYLFSGGAPKELSTIGVSRFLSENLDFKLLSHFPEYENIDNKSTNGIGFSMGIDHDFSRLVITKRDYVPNGDVVYEGGVFKSGGSSVDLGDSKYFCDVSFTLTYDFRRKVWVSFHSYKPTLYMFNRGMLMSYGNGGIWIHNKDHHFQTFYGSYEPSMVEYVVLDKSTSSFKYISSDVDSESSFWSGYSYVHSIRRFFNKVFGYNSHQSTGMLDFVDKDKLSTLDASKETCDIVLGEFKMRRWNHADFYDRLKLKDLPIFDPVCEVGVKKFNIEAHSDECINDEMFDNHIVVGYVMDSGEQVKILIKRVFTDIDTENI